MYKIIRTYSLVIALGTIAYSETPNLENNTTQSTKEQAINAATTLTISNAEITKIKAIAKAEAKKSKIIAKAIKEKNIIEAEAIQIQTFAEIEAKTLAEINITKEKEKIAKKEAILEMKSRTEAATIMYNKTIEEADLKLQNILNKIEKKNTPAPEKIEKKKPTNIHDANTVDVQNLFNKLLKNKQIIFQKGRNTLTKESDSCILDIVSILKHYPKIKIELAGYTDSDGSRVLNQKLSQKRVNAIKNILLLQGIEKKRIRSKGYGESNPIVPNSTEKNKQKNRRIEIHVL